VGAALRTRWLVNAGSRNEKPFSLRRRPARSEAERIKEMLLDAGSTEYEARPRNQNVCTVTRTFNHTICQLKY